MQSMTDYEAFLHSLDEASKDWLYGVRPVAKTIGEQSISQDDLDALNNQSFAEMKQIDYELQDRL